ncbi:Regulator of competence-specific genes [Collimonas arenae]|uniref:Regulator of competence-specific genes n=1 Tax=Collimonas arenae TaxID=279058 RepID=A0A0A1FAM5_9BURK|nr:Regulator of competence-specific genes [Collimonas arenae]
MELAEFLAPLGQITVSRFFGGAGLSIDKLQFAFVIKGTLYLRVDERSRPAFEARGCQPFRYATKEKTVTVGSYYEVPAEIADEPDALLDWVSRLRRGALS